MTDLCIMIVSCSFGSWYERPDKHSVNAGCSNYKNTNDDLSNNSTQIYQRKEWAKEDNKMFFPVFLRAIQHKEKIEKNDCDLDRISLI